MRRTLLQSDRHYQRLCKPAAASVDRQLFFDNPADGNDEEKKTDVKVLVRFTAKIFEATL